MNMQALMKQAQAMQKDITNIKNEIDSSVFEGRSSLVTVSVKGTKEIVSVKIELFIRFYFKHKTLLTIVRYNYSMSFHALMRQQFCGAYK